MLWLLPLGFDWSCRCRDLPLCGGEGERLSFCLASLKNGCCLLLELAPTRFGDGALKLPLWLLLLVDGVSLSRPNVGGPLLCGFRIGLDRGDADRFWSLLSKTDRSYLNPELMPPLVLVEVWASWRILFWQGGVLLHSTMPFVFRGQFLKYSFWSSIHGKLLRIFTDKPLNQSVKIVIFRCFRNFQPLETCFENLNRAKGFHTRRHTFYVSGERSSTRRMLFTLTGFLSGGARSVPTAKSLVPGSYYT